MNTQLTIVEESRLEQLESTIDRGLKTFVEVGKALLEIRDSRLYRETFGTFEDYCRDRWGMERRQAYRLIDASNAVANVSHGTQTLPTSERQARPLTSLEPEQQREVWAEVVGTHEPKEITAAVVKETVERITKPHVAHNSGENEWYTPSNFIELAREVMGSIDLDPASCEQANFTVDASVIYTKENDGLAHDWFGNVWLNPPYAQPLISEFADKVVEQRDNYEQCIVLVNNATETKWFQKISSVASAVCFPTGRVRFYDPLGNLGAPLQGQAIIYMGQNIEQFIFTMRPIGLTLIISQ